MPRAVILIDHGSRVDEANRLLDQVAALVQQRTRDRVYVAHMELAEPTLDQAFASAARDGADQVFVFPYFLAPGRHSTDDIPRMCNHAAVQTGLAYHCGDPIGLESELADLIVRRVAQCPDDAYRPGAVTPRPSA